jgi:lipopolysaccharide transport system ATP-binding protein
MSKAVIKAGGLSKRYRIGAAVKGYKTFSEALVEGLTAPAKNLAKLKSMTRFKDTPEENSILVLNDVSFEVDEGDVLGIIGGNGAGKTTLLKILSRITWPTGGQVEIYGRISSLLEVGTGFHPELTGRENIFLNGAILGMRKREIEKRFDEIVDFAGLEKFLDTPVKRYSSGMYVRLAFSVAAHLEPEILLVDEVLAVGDLAFRKKCLGKMGDISQSGRTVLFVSHDMGAVKNLCGAAIWLDSGKMMKKGAPPEIIRLYQESQLQLYGNTSCVVERSYENIKNKSLYFSRVEICNLKGEYANTFKYDEQIMLLVNLDGGITSGDYSAEFYIYNELGQLVSVGASGPYHGQYFGAKVKRLRIEIGPLILTSGQYAISLSVIYKMSRADTWENAVGFNITECQPFAAECDIPTFREGVCVLNQSFVRAD